MSTRIRPTGHIIEGHEFTGWEPATPLSEEIQGRVDVLNELFDGQALDDGLKKLEGDLVSTCECGWRGLPEDWKAPRSRSRNGGMQHINHKHNEQLERINQTFAADMAAAALAHAAEAWTGDEDVAEWLRARADHVQNVVGLYDGKNWP